VLFVEFGVYILKLVIKIEKRVFVLYFLFF